MASVSWDLMSQQDAVSSQIGRFDLLTQDVARPAVESFEEAPPMKGDFGLMSQDMGGQHTSWSAMMASQGNFELASQDFPPASAWGLSSQVARAVVGTEVPAQVSGMEVAEPTSSTAAQPQIAESPSMAVKESCVAESTNVGKDELSTTVLKQEISAALVGRDLTKTSLKDFRRELEGRLELEPGTLDARKEEVGELIAEEFQRIQTAGDAPTTPKKKHRSKHGHGAKSEHKKTGAKTNGKWISNRGHKRSRKGMVGEDEDSDKADGNKRHHVALLQGREAVQPTVQQADFLGSVEPLVVEVGDHTLKLPAKLFASGNCGFYNCAKISLNINGVPREALCQINCALIGSREWAHVGHDTSEAPDVSVSTEAPDASVNTEAPSANIEAPDASVSTEAPVASVS